MTQSKETPRFVFVDSPGVTITGLTTDHGKPAFMVDGSIIHCPSCGSERVDLVRFTALQQPPWWRGRLHCNACGFDQTNGD